MIFNRHMFVLLLVFSISFLPIKSVQAGFEGLRVYSTPETDSSVLGGDFLGLSSIFYVFDLRDRETFIQLTYPDGTSTGFPGLAHIQIFDVSNNCNENNFFDNYTINDTHVYNLSDIVTNDGNPSGVVLPEGAYGIIAVTMYSVFGTGTAIEAGHFGNLRIVDSNGYEYRTNAQGFVFQEVFDFDQALTFYSFNFNQQNGVSLSDIYGITLLTDLAPISFEFEWIATPVQGIFSPFDIDIVDNNEVLFSCRDIVFSCVNDSNILLEELLGISGISVASFDYGINDAIPSSRNSELLCPNNIIGEGTVILKSEPYPTSAAFTNIISSIGSDVDPLFLGFVGLNNGNGRGSMDSIWIFNNELREN